MTEDNWDIEFDALLEKQYGKNRSDKDRYEDSNRFESDIIEKAEQQEVQEFQETDSNNLEDDSNSGFVNNLIDFGKYIPIGVAKGVEETAQTLRIADDNAFNLPEPKNIGGSLGRGIGQFLPLFMGGGLVLRGGAKMLGLFQKSSKLSKAGQHLISIGAGGLADAVAFDPKDATIGNLALTIGAISESPRASAMVKTYLAQQDEDSELKARAKAALIGGLAGEIVGALGKGMAYAFKGSKVKVSEKSKIAEDGIDEDGFLREIDEDTTLPEIDKGVEKAHNIIQSELEEAALPIAQDAVDIIDAVKGGAKGNPEAFSEFNKIAPTADEAIVQSISKAEASVNKWFDELSSESPKDAEDIIDYFHKRINGEINLPVADFIIRGGRNKGKPLIESMNFLRLDTEEDARQTLQFISQKLDIKKLSKGTPEATEDLDTVIPELLGLTNSTDPLEVNSAIKQVALAAHNVEEAVKYVGTSKLMASILDDQLQLASKADTTPAARKHFESKLNTQKMILTAGGLLSSSASKLLRSFGQTKKASDTTALLRREATMKLHEQAPEVRKASSNMFSFLKEEGEIVKKLHYAQLKTTRKVSISRAETSTGKRITNRVNHLKKKLKELMSPTRGKLPPKKAVTSTEIKALQEKIKKVQFERATLKEQWNKSEQMKLRKQAAKLSKEINALVEGKTKNPLKKQKKTETTEIAELKARKTAELKKVNDKLKGSTTQQNINRLNTQYSNLLLKRISQDSPATPIAKAEKTSIEKELEKAIVREKNTIREKVTTKELQEELILKGSRQMQKEINDMDLRQLKTRSLALQKGARAKTMDTILELNVNGLLSGFKTIGIVNPVGTGSALVSTIIERAFAGAMGKDIFMRESALLAWNSISGLGDAWKTFKSVMRRGSADPNVKSDLGAIKVHDRAISKEHFGLHGPLGYAVDFMGTVINLPGKLLLSTDQAFKSLIIRGETKALAYRKARSKFEGENIGLAEVKIKIDKEMQNIMDNLLSHPDIGDGAQSLANKTTFTNDLADVKVSDGKGGEIPIPGINKRIGTMLDRYGFMKIFVPFFKTPVQILEFTRQRTPLLQFTSQALRKELTSSDPAVKQLAQARVGTSMAIYGGMFSAAMSGNFTGAPPKDPKLRATMEAKMGGRHWFSVNFMGKWRKYDRVDPYGVLMASAAGLASMGKNMINLNKKEGEEGDESGDINRKYDEVFSDTIVGIAGMVKDRHYIQGISEFISFVSGDARGLSPTLKRLSTALDPRISFYSAFRRGTTKGLDSDKIRKAQRGVGTEDGLKKTGISAIADEIYLSHQEAMASVTPGYGNIPAQKNLIGDVVSYAGTNGSFDAMENIITSMLNPSPGLIPSKSPLINKLAELEMTISQPHTLTKIGNIVLTEEEKSFVIDKWTERNKSIIEPLVTQSWFNNLPTGMQAKLLEEFITDMRQAAQKEATVKFDRLGKNVMDDTIRRLTAQSRERPQGFQSILQGN